MTYRRYFNYLLAASLVILLGAWAYSTGHQSGVHVSASRQVFSITIANGSLAAAVRSGGSVSSPLTASFMSQKVPMRPYALFGEWRLIGQLQPPPPGFPTPPGPIPELHLAMIPLWAVWLFGIGSLLVCFKRLEKRSAPAKEKRLAESAASDRVAGDPA
ncbi:MAG: hypothetical protein EOP88_12565 [Verrucomicrobiaceae bacterium]|nr:MAG: hypothetical protein EOP88_12565 [Verrucomicrobiaceae bacterium]